jgi:hypothetical protein
MNRHTLAFVGLLGFLQRRSIANPPPLMRRGDGSRVSPNRLFALSRRPLRKL